MYCTYGRCETFVFDGKPFLFGREFRGGENRLSSHHHSVIFKPLKKQFIHSNLDQLFPLKTRFPILNSIMEIGFNKVDTEIVEWKFKHPLLDFLLWLQFLAVSYKWLDHFFNCLGSKYPCVLLEDNYGALNLIQILNVLRQTNKQNSQNTVSIWMSTLYNSQILDFSLFHNANGILFF